MLSSLQPRKGLDLIRPLLLSISLLLMSITAQAADIPAYSATVGRYYSGGGGTNPNAISKTFFSYEEALDWLDHQAQKAQFRRCGDGNCADDPLKPLTDKPLAFLRRLNIPPRRDYYVHDLQVGGPECVGNNGCGCFFPKTAGSAYIGIGNVVYAPKTAVYDATNHLHRGTDVAPGLCPTPLPGEDPWYLTVFYSTAWIDYVTKPDQKDLGPCCTSITGGPTLVGRPINVATGNKYLQETDFSSPTLSLRRHYNSLGETFGPLGNKWRHEYQRSLRLDPEAPTIIVALRDDGKVLKFTNVNSVWTTDVDVNDRLARNATTNKWEYLNADNELETYDDYGRLIAIRNADGMTRTLTYTGALKPKRARVLDVTDDFGRKLTFTYMTNGLLEFITDSVGQQYKFSFSPAGNLEEVEYPTATRRRYEYTDAVNPLLLTRVLDEDAKVAGVYTYEANGRANSTAVGADESKLTVGGMNSGIVSVTDLRSSSRSYRFVYSNNAFKSYSISAPGLGTEYTVRNDGTAGTIGSSATGTLRRHHDYKGNRTCFFYVPGRNLEESRVEGLGPNYVECVLPIPANQTLPVTRMIATSWHDYWRLPREVTSPRKRTVFKFHGDANVSCAEGASASTALVCSVSEHETTDTTGFAGLGASNVGTPRTREFTYDQFGRIKTQKDARGNQTTYEYYAMSVSGNRKGMLQYIKNSLQHTVEFVSYDGHGRVTELKLPNNLTTTLEYNSRGWLKKRITGSETVRYDYDNAGHLQVVTQPDGSFMRLTYDAAQRVNEVLSSTGDKIVYSFDVLGNREEATYFVSGNTVAVKKSKQTFDVHSRVEKSYYGAQADLTTPYLQLATFGYDGNGNRRSVKDAAMRDVLSDFDELNRRSRVTVKAAPSDHVTDFTYDAQNNLIKVVEPTTPKTGGGTRRLETNYGYTGFGELKQQSSPDTGITDFTYDAAGNLDTRKNARGHCEKYSYDALNRITSVKFNTDCSATTDSETPVTYDYDGVPSTCLNGVGKICRITDKTGTTTYSYDTMGRITGKLQVAGGLTQSVSYGYVNGRLDSITYPSGRVVKYNYNGGRVESMQVNGSTVLMGVSYQPFGPASSWTWGNSTSTAPNVHTRNYDMDGRIKGIASAGADTRYTFNNLSLIEKIEGVDTSGTAIPAKSITYGYADPFDRLTSQTPGTGNMAVSQSFGYDAVGNRRSQTIGSTNTTFGFFDTSNRLSSSAGGIVKAYVYDNAGNLETDGTNTWTYGFDNRPTNVSKLVGGNLVETLFGINALGQRVKKTGTSTTLFVYDEAGHLIGEYLPSGTAIREHLWFGDIPVGVLK